MPTTKHEQHDEPAPAAKTVAAQPGVLTQPEPGPGAPLVGATGVKGEHIADGERDPDTIAEEQRRRSAYYEEHGYGINQTAATVAAAKAPPPPLQHQPAHKDDHHTTKK